MNRKIIFITSVIAGLLLSQIVFAQTAPQIIMTWKADTYVPPGFKGKRMPVVNSKVRVYAELLQNGSLVDLSKRDLAWYVNGSFLDEGLGLQTVEFDVSRFFGSSVRIKVQIKDSIAKNIDVPITNPRAIIESPFPSNEFYTRNINLTGKPLYFYSQNQVGLDGFDFSWTTNGDQPASFSFPEILNVSLQPSVPAGTRININLKINGPNGVSASTNKQLIFQ